jgi:ABC-type dipeptide/oligopeptide/nickel transport system ATPase component
MLSVDNLNIQFKTPNGLFDAVKGISFQLAKGETIGIVGESGSGKSVTSLSFNAVAG